MKDKTESVRRTLFAISANAECSHADGRVDDNDNTLLEQYKLFVGTSEALVLRRQNVNTFFLSVNSILLAGEGLLLREDDLSSLASVAIVGFAVGGTMLLLRMAPLDCVISTVERRQVCRHKRNGKKAASADVHCRMGSSWVRWESQGLPTVYQR